MSVNWGLVGTNPFADFSTADLEDLIYKYIGNNWGLTASELTKAAVFGTTVQNDMVNRPWRANRPYWIWVNFDRETAARTSIGSTLGRTGYIQFQSTFIIHTFAYRLTESLTFPELGQIAREVQRLLFQYPISWPTMDIPGIKHFDNWQCETVGKVTDLGESFAGTYELLCRIDAIYQKESTI